MEYSIIILITLFFISFEKIIFNINKTSKN